MFVSNFCARLLSPSLYGYFLLLITLLDNPFATAYIRVYWNVPTFMCTKYGISFTDVEKEYGVIQNVNDTFRGNEISILYDPGNFPALLENSSSGRLVKRNGGVPQEGNLAEHLKIFTKHLDELIPNKDYEGLAVIDFESWRPVFRQNFGTLQPYRNLSIRIEREKHRNWSHREIVREATKVFENSGRKFMEQTLKKAKAARPNALWGYYAFPYCFNGNSRDPLSCSNEVQQENNRIMWLFENSDVILPSVYLTEAWAPNMRKSIIKGRVGEANRVARATHKRPRPHVLTYIRYAYTDTLNFLSQGDLYDAFSVMDQKKSDGILWGSSFDLNSQAKCRNFRKYLEDQLGPILRLFTKPKYSVQGIIHQQWH
ncbi:hyaluronidase Tab y 2.0101-like [Lutzomyia longipalpis]|uniref:Hyaluronidase n=2 Tax=Lutzomyia longipalpis TaxID=7200 RepID=A0A7G3AJY0_LUTLO|nr:hyaluronidase Tab y 2.0101-like [Lutzomyia longipalpis]XP_055687644.1 hyaluronidase Tab y 2.0101-like [Lutzomyia longipalpis]